MNYRDWYNIYPGGQVAFYLDLSMPAGASIPYFNLTASVGKEGLYSTLEFCQIELIHIGKYIPCLTEDDVNITLISSLSEGPKDKVNIYIEKITNIREHDDYWEHNDTSFRFMVVAQVRDQNDLIDWPKSSQLKVRAVADYGSGTEIEMATVQWTYRNWQGELSAVSNILLYSLLITLVM